MVVVYVGIIACVSKMVFVSRSEVVPELEQEVGGREKKHEDVCRYPSFFLVLNAPS